MRSKNKIKHQVGPARPSQQEPRGRKNDNIIFIICIIIAFVFWGMIKLSDNYDVSYSFKIQYENIPIEKRLTVMVDSTVDVNFDATGFMVMRLNLFEDMSTLVIDLDEISIWKEGNEYLINTNELRDMFASIIGVPETDIRFSTTMLGFVLEDLHEKEIKVLPDLSIKYKEQYDLYEQALTSPPKVKVYGPKATIDTLTEVYTQNIMLQGIDEDRMLSVAIANPHPSLLRFDPDHVEINLRVERFTESSIEIPIDFSGVNQNIQSFPSSVKVYFKVAQKDFNNIQAGDFTVKPELKGVKLLEVDRLHLSLIQKPEFIRNERVVPTYVEFLITK